MPYILISTKEDSLPGGVTLVCDGHSLTFLAVENVSNSTVKIGANWINLPKSHSRAILIEKTCGDWAVFGYEPTGEIDPMAKTKLFVVYGQVCGPVGIRTSLDWDITHWGSATMSLPGVWFVPCILPSDQQGSSIEYKAVLGGHEVIWEQPAFCNKKVHLKATTQVIIGHWGVQDIDAAEMVPNYKKTVEIGVEIPYDMHKELIPPRCHLCYLVLRDCRDDTNKRLFNKGHQAQFSYNQSLRRYTTKMAVPRTLDRLRFKLAIVDDQNSITHLDHLSFANEDGRSRSRLVEFNKQSVVRCAYFVDVRPFKWCIEHSAVMYKLPVAIKAIYELLTEPIKDKYKVTGQCSPTGFKLSCDNSATCRKLMVTEGDIKQIIEVQSSF